MLTYLEYCEGFIERVVGSTFHGVNFHRTDCQNFVIVFIKFIFNRMDGFPEGRLFLDLVVSVSGSADRLPRIDWLCNILDMTCRMLDIYSAGVADVVYLNCCRILPLILSEWNQCSRLLIAFAMPSYHFHTLACGFMAPLQSFYFISTLSTGQIFSRKCIFWLFPKLKLQFQN